MVSVTITAPMFNLLRGLALAGQIEPDSVPEAFRAGIDSLASALEGEDRTAPGDVEILLGPAAVLLLADAWAPLQVAYAIGRTYGNTGDMRLLRDELGDLVTRLRAVCDEAWRGVVN